MAIYKANTIIEAYRARARSAEINDLSGRIGMPQQTKVIAQHIIQEIEVRRDDVIVDIGCGDGSFLCMAAEAGVDPWFGRLIGVLPTDEEIHRVHGYFLKSNLAKGGVQFTRGLSHNTVLPDGFATKVVSNGVFLLLDDEQLVDQSLLEIYRITKPGGLVFIGELPDADESTLEQGFIRSNDNLLIRIVKVLVRYGPLEIIRRMIKRGYLTLNRELVIISPKAPFWIHPNMFIEKLDKLGFDLVKYYPCEKNNLTSGETATLTSVRRWNYIATRKYSSLHIGG